ncbi:MAG: WecB/TagA/CpsF family glycosyltransferase, partial [Gaiellaceae bacterium]
MGSLEQAAEAVVDRALTGGGGYACLANVHVVTTAQNQPALKQALHQAWMVFPDGAPVAWLAGRTAKSSSERIAGSELMESVIAEGQKSGLRHFLFGSTPEVLEKLEERLLSLYPGARIVGLL